MDQLAAVVTTGIYCRPSCGANPSPQNVEAFPTAAAAEAAGYRACFRCRPYRSAQVVAWSNPEMVCRAVKLILAGILDESTESELGDRLGISGRHLRRLFLTHLGATPSQLATSSRAHFARRLLDDTDLSVAEIAFMAGFGSVRQLNRVCRSVFRDSPTGLRARRHKSDRLVADGGLPLRLSFSGALDWEAMLAHFAHSAIPGVEIVQDGVYRRSVLVDGDPGVLEFSSGGQDHILLTAHLPHWEGLMHLVAQARQVFNLDSDPGEALRVLSQDPTIGHLVEAHPGIRAAGTWDAFETGVSVILGRNSTPQRRDGMLAAIIENFGTPVPHLSKMGLTHLFPSASTLASGDLDGLGLSSTRALSVRAFAQAIEDDRLRLDGSVGLDSLVSSISSLPGLGVWTAHCIALRLGEPDAFPATDMTLMRAAGQLDPRLDSNLAELALRWSPWRATAAMHLWTAPLADVVREQTKTLQPVLR